MSKDDAAKTPRWRRFIRCYVLPYIWYVHAPTAFMLRAEPVECLQRMRTAARPSTQRLHLRNLFAEGRRYHIEEKRHGFRLTTTSKATWSYRKRTSSTAILHGTFSHFDDEITRLNLVTRINVGYLLDIFLLPVFMTSLLVFMPWHPAVIVVLVAVLFSLSWIGHRYNARLEANALVWFVQKSLEDLVSVEVKNLQDVNPHVVDARQEFDAAWERFYEAMKAREDDQQEGTSK